MDDEDALDIEAMARTADGDVEAFCEIVRRHQDMLLNFFRRLGADTDEAADLVQETFLRLYQWRKRYKPSARFKTFLFTLARHARTDGLRKKGRTVKTVADDPPDAFAGAEDTARTVEHRLDVREALASLSEKLRSVVVLNVYHGLNHREIAEVLEIPEGTVKSRMFLAMRQLRDFLQPGEEADRDGGE